MIELVVVLIVIGILAAFASARFTGLRSDAARSVVDGAAGALRSMSALATAQARIDEVDNGTITAVGTSVPIIAGHAAAVWTGGIQHLLGIGTPDTEIAPTAECTTSNLCAAGAQTSLPGLGAVSGQAVLVWPRNYRATDQCYAWYNNPGTGAAPAVGTRITGC